MKDALKVLGCVVLAAIFGSYGRTTLLEHGKDTPMFTVGIILVLIAGAFIGLLYHVLGNIKPDE